jgi:hypothetical protein
MRLRGREPRYQPVCTAVPGARPQAPHGALRARSIELGPAPPVGEGIFG